MAFTYLIHYVFPSERAFAYTFCIYLFRFSFIPYLLSAYDFKILDTRDTVVNKTYEAFVLAFCWKKKKKDNKQMQTYQQS